MSSHTLYGLIGILLSLLMYFAYLSFFPTNEGIVIQTEFRGPINYAPDCGRHVIAFRSDNKIKIHNQLVSV